MNSYCSHFIPVCLFLLLWGGDVLWDDRTLVLVLPGSYAFSICHLFFHFPASQSSFWPGREWELQWLCWPCLMLLMPVSSMARLTPKKESKPKYVSGFELQIWVFKMHEMRNFGRLLQHESTCVGHEWHFLFMLRLLNTKLKQMSRQLWTEKTASGWRRGRVWCVHHYRLWLWQRKVKEVPRTRYSKFISYLYNNV